MGFYIKDLYVQRVPKFKWHDKLTNPPTIPETSPIIRAALSVALVREGGAGADALPADDTQPVPSPITPIAINGRLVEADLQVVRENLLATLEVVEGRINELTPSAEDLEYVKSVVG